MISGSPGGFRKGQDRKNHWKISTDKCKMEIALFFQVLKS